ncbi:MAG: sugar phosphate nucleotidyltransferase [bacterium]|nr:sugar phosphate nucleotidyltransferase [bacterium]
MKGIILAGGEGTRLRPLTLATSKQLLPVYNKPMVMYPLATLLSGGIRDILIIVAPDHPGDYQRLLGSGKDFGARFSYQIQDKPEGLAQAFIIGERFIGGDSVAMILGDNIFEDDFSATIKNFKSGGQVFAKEVPDPERFGVVKFDNDMNAVAIEEKPKTYLSNYAITGLYVYDNSVVQAARESKPSARGELEITDIHNWYLRRGELKVDIVKGKWFDAGTFDSLLAASNFAAQKKK